MESTVLVKTFLLLEELSREDEPTSLAALAERVELAKPTVHRLMKDLIALGYVERVGTGRYQLTDKLRALGMGGAHRRLLTKAEPVLTKLHKLTGETVNLGELRRDKIIYLRVIESTHPLRRVITAGEKHQALSTALGRAIIAYLPVEDQDKLLNRATVAAMTPETTLDMKTLRDLITKVRRSGYAFERNEDELGVTCFGAPVFKGDEVVTAISMSVPSARIDDSNEQGLIESTKQAAAELSKAISS